MKKYLLFLLSIMGMSGIVQAQSSEDIWNIFDVASQKVDLVQINNSVAAQSDDMVPLAIVSEDDRKEITGKASGLEKAVVVLEMDFGGEKALCSGSMVGPNVVLTAAHCLNYGGEYMNSVQVYAVGLPGSKNNVKSPVTEDPGTVKLPGGVIRSLPPKGGMSDVKDIDPIIRRLQPKLSEISQLKDLSGKILTQVATQTKTNNSSSLKDILNGLHEEGYPSAAARKLWVPSQWIKYNRNTRDGSVNLEKEEQYDYGLIVLDNALGNQTGYLGLHAPSSSELRRANILVVGRGGDKPARSLWRGRGRVGEVHARYFFHNADQVGGNSGGPIFDVRNTNKIIALANFGDSRQHVSGGYPNGGLRITAEIINAVQKAAD